MDGLDSTCISPAAGVAAAHGLADCRASVLATLQRSEPAVGAEGDAQRHWLVFG